MDVFFWEGNNLYSISKNSKISTTTSYRFPNYNWGRVSRRSSTLLTKNYKDLKTSIIDSNPSGCPSGLGLRLPCWRSQVRNPLPAKARGLPSGSSSSHQACLVRVTSPMWFASYCIGAGVLPCAHPKGSGCGFPLSSKIFIF